VANQRPSPLPQSDSRVTITSQHGRVVTVRHLQPSDDGLLVDLYRHLSPQTRWFRFFQAATNLSDELLWQQAFRLAHVDPQTQAALIATIGEHGHEVAIGVARLARSLDDPYTAELAIVLRDDCQREGLGGMLLDLLVQIALSAGMKKLRGIMLPDNTAIQKVIRSFGMPVKTEVHDGTITMTVDLQT
jgi:acetyltransferase